MKLQQINKSAVALILIALAPYANAQNLSENEYSNIRAVLRSLNVKEEKLSNNQIESLRRNGYSEKAYLDMKKAYVNNVVNGAEVLTCGAGTHGGSGDPVGK